MIRYSRLLTVFLLLSTVLVSCKKEENSIPVIGVSPFGPDIDAIPGDVLSFGISGTSDNSTLARLTITAKRANNFTQTLKDTLISGSSLNWTWEYLVATSTESYTEKLTFTLYDAEGATMATTRTLYVTMTATILTETSGHMFYSRNSLSHPESAFDLQERLPVLHTVDSTRRDIQDDPIDEFTTELSRNWISPAGGRLVRFNGYDYANATDMSLRAAYHAGIPVEQLPNVAVGDIILTKLGSLPANTSFYAAMRITDILDEGGTAENDHYVFNMKWTVFVE